MSRSSGIHHGLEESAIGVPPPVWTRCVDRTELVSPAPIALFNCEPLIGEQRRSVENNQGVGSDPPHDFAAEAAEGGGARGQGRGLKCNALLSRFGDEAKMRLRLAEND